MPVDKITTMYGTLRRNIAGQEIHFYLWDNNGAVTGGALTYNVFFSRDGGTPQVTVGGTSFPSEIDATNLPGWYAVRPDAGETDGDVLILRVRSDNENVTPFPREVVTIIHTRPDHDSQLMGSGFTSLTDSLASLQAALADSLIAVTRDD